PAAAWPKDILPRPDHVVVVIEENKAYDEVIGNSNAPYINQLARRGALMTQSYAVAHPSLPNYLAIFSGSTQGISDDGCQYQLTGPNLYQSLKAKGLAFQTFSEDLPQEGFGGCKSTAYRKKHNPAAYFSGIANQDNRSFNDFPADFSKLPAVCFVVPNLDNDMH